MHEIMIKWSGMRSSNSILCFRFVFEYFFREIFKYPYDKTGAFYKRILSNFPSPAIEWEGEMLEGWFREEDLSRATL